MENSARAITWEAPEHHHVEKNGDWFWIAGIMTLVLTVVTFILGNFLLAIVVLLAGGMTILVANKTPAIIPFAVSTRGLRIGSTLHPYATLECFYLDEDHPDGPQLLARSNKLFMPLLIMPLPEEYIAEIEQILETRLPEEHLEEPFSHKVLELFGL